MIYYTNFKDQIFKEHEAWITAQPAKWQVWRNI